MICKKDNSKINIFTIDNKQLEFVNSYKYLGILVAKTGSFGSTKDMLSAKSLKVCYFIRRVLSSCKVPTIKAAMTAFDAMVMPILSYGSEIWGAYEFGAKQFQGININENAPYEKIATRFYKQILQVPTKSTHLAVRGELGRYPIIYEITRRLIKYWVRLEGIDNRLLSEAYLLVKGKNYKWYQTIQSILHTLDVNWNIDFSNKQAVTSFISEVDLNLRSYLEEQWYENMHDDSPKGPRRKSNQKNKLRTYRLFKRTFKFEEYLESCYPAIRVVLTKFRISAHDLAIEVGRRTGVEEYLRTCAICQDSIENEIHFLVKCNLYASLREDLFETLDFSNMDSDTESFVSLMTHSKITKVAEFVKNAFKIRNQQVS